MKTDYTDIKFADDGRLKLLIIVGTRPEIIRLAAIIRRCREYFDVILAHTGQNYDYNLNGIFFRDLGIGAPEVYMDVVGDDLGETVGNIISGSYKLMRAVRPEALLILGDTNSCLAAIAAKRLHVPVFHMEAGNRAMDERLPEETNRRIVDVISDVNLCYSEHARRRLTECGLPQERVFVVGSPMAEVLRENLEAIERSDIHGRLGLKRGRYLLLSAHREENVDNEDRLRRLFGAVNALAVRYDMPVVYSCHPRSRKRLEAAEVELDRRVMCLEPMGFHDYNCLQMYAGAVISDSGTLAEEASFFCSGGKGFPAVSLRESTERPEGLENGVFMLGGIDEQGLMRTVEMAMEMHGHGEHGQPVEAYMGEGVSRKIVRIIQSMSNRRHYNY